MAQLWDSLYILTFSFPVEIFLYFTEKSQNYMFFPWIWYVFPFPDFLWYIISYMLAGEEERNMKYNLTTCILEQLAYVAGRWMLLFASFMMWTEICELLAILIFLSLHVCSVGWFCGSLKLHSYTVVQSSVNHPSWWKESSYHLFISQIPRPIYLHKYYKVI